MVSRTAVACTCVYIYIYIIYTYIYNIYIYMRMNPYAMFDHMGAIFLRSGFAQKEKVIAASQNNHMAAPVKVARQQTTPELSPEPSEPASGTYTSTHRNSPEPSGTCLRNPLEYASGTYISTNRNSVEPSRICLRNLHQHTPEFSKSSGTFRNVPPELIWPEDAMMLFRKNRPGMPRLFFLLQADGLDPSVHSRGVGANKKPQHRRQPWKLGFLTKDLKT